MNPLSKGDRPPISPKAPPPPPTGLTDPRLRVTLAITLINAAALVACATYAAEPGDPFDASRRVLGMGLTGALYRFGATAGYLLEAGEWWRLVAAFFLHHGVVHLMLNMIALFLFATWVEPTLGRWRYLTLYLAAGVAGNLFAHGMTSLSILMGFEPSTISPPSVGASGAVFGVIGALFAGGWVARGSFWAFATAPQARRMVVFILFLLFFGFVFPDIDGSAHLGGFLAGLFMGLHFFCRRSVRSRPFLAALGFHGVCALAVGCALSALAAARPVKVSHERGMVIVDFLSQAFGRPDLSLEWISGQMRSGEPDLVWQRQRARVLLAACRYEEGRREATRALGLSAGDPLATFTRGICLWRLGQPGEALDSLAAAESAALAEEPVPAWVEEAGLARALILKELGREDASRRARDALVGRLVAEADAASSAVARLEALAEESDDPSRAREAVEAARQRVFEAASKRNTAAWVCAELDGRVEEAMGWISLALDEMPLSAFVDTRGWLLYRQERYRAALRDFLAAEKAALAPSAEISYHIGATLARLGRIVEARGYLERSLELEQDFNAIHDARNLLETLAPPSDGPTDLRDLV